MRSLAILSHKGGVGKTSIAVNIAVYLAKQGKNVCLLDTDLHGPSVMTFFKPQAKWINNYCFGAPTYILFILAIRCWNYIE